MTVELLTASVLFTDALLEIGAIGIGQTIPADIGEICRRSFNGMVESHDIDSRFIYTSRYDLFTLVANTQSYTMGEDPNGALTPTLTGSVRPDHIKSIVIHIQTTPNILRSEPLARLSQAQWAELRNLGVYTIPDSYYLKRDFPLSTIYFYPAPDFAYPVEFWTWQQGGHITLLTDEIAYPKGYRDYWLYNLARRLCGPFQKPVTQDLMDNLRRASEPIISMNSKPPEQQSDAAVCGGSRPFDWLTGYE